MNEIGLDQFDLMRETATVVDVLPRPSFRSGHIPGAINLPFEDVELRAADVLPDAVARIVVYCGGPNCPLGHKAQKQLLDIGYEHVTHYVGGLEEWTAAGRSVDREIATVADDEPANRILKLVDSLPLSQWIGIWISMVIGCASVFWLIGQTSWAGLYHNGKPLPTGIVSIGDCLYFSVVTATTLGYGDITPVTAWARVLASLEAISGMVLVGALISKLLSTHQEQLLRETHDLTFNERLGRIQTSLHLLISEFQSITSAHEAGASPESRIDLRLTSSSALLIRDLRVVRDLLHQRKHRADDSAMELILVTLDGALESYLALMSICQSDQSRSARQLGELVEEICADCVPHQYSEDIKSLIDRTHLLAQKILGIAGTS